MATEVPYTPFPTVLPQGVRQPSGTAGQGMVIGGASQNLGAGVGSAAQDVASIDFKKWQLQDELIANDANTAAQRSASDLLSNFEQLKGEEANKALPKFQSDLQQLYEDSLGKMPNLQTQTMLSGSMQYTMSYYGRYARQHADSELMSWHNTSTKLAANEFGLQAAIAVLAPDGINYRAFDANLAASDNEIQKNDIVEHYDQPYIDAEIKTNRSANISTAIDSAFALDPLRAEELYNKYGSQLLKSDLAAVTGRLRTFVNSQEASQAAADVAAGRPIQPFVSPIKIPSPTALPPIPAGNLTSREEGFDARPTQDVDGTWIIGHGSSFVTHADGSVERVTPNTAPITVADADRDMARQRAQYIAKDRIAVGPDIWDKLPADVQETLFSNSYNYGSLYPSIIAAAKTGDLNQLANAVQNQPVGNADKPQIAAALVGRRHREADIIRGAIGQPAGYQHPADYTHAPDQGGVQTAAFVVPDAGPAGPAPPSAAVPAPIGAAAPAPPAPSATSTNAPVVPVDPNTGLPDKSAAQAAIMEHFKDRPDLQSQALSALNKAYEDKNAAFADWQHGQELQRSKEEQAARTAEQQYIGAMNSPNPPPNLQQQILADPRLGSVTSAVPTETKNRLLAALNGGQASATRSHSFVNDAMRRMSLADGDPRKLTDTGELFTAMGNNQINKEDFNFLYGLLNDSKTQSGQNLTIVRGNFVKSVASRVTGSDLGIGKVDPIGDDNMYRLQWDLVQAEARAKADHKDPLSIYDPKSPNFVGNVATKYIRPMSQIIQDTIDLYAAGLGGTTTTPPPAVTVPPPAAAPAAPAPVTGGAPAGPKAPVMPAPTPAPAVSGQNFSAAPAGIFAPVTAAPSAPAAQPAQPSPTAPNNLPTNPDDFLNQLFGAPPAKGAEETVPRVSDELASRGAAPADLTGLLAPLIGDLQKNQGETDEAYRRRVSGVLSKIYSEDFTRLNVNTRQAILRLRADYAK